MYWNFTYSGKIYEYEAATELLIMQMADEWWAEQCKFENLKNGEVRSNVVDLLQINEDGQLMLAKPYFVNYQHYHGDFKEHNIYGL